MKKNACGAFCLRSFLLRGTLCRACRFRDNRACRERDCNVVFVERFFKRLGHVPFHFEIFGTRAPEPDDNVDRKITHAVDHDDRFLAFRGDDALVTVDHFLQNFQGLVDVVVIADPDNDVLPAVVVAGEILDIAVPEAS